MHRTFVVLAVLGLALVACDVSSTPETVASNASPTATSAVRSGTLAPTASAPAAVAATAAPATVAPPPATVAPPPVPVARVTVLPASSGKLGSSFLLQLSGFPAGKLTTTITNPNGIPKAQLGQIGADGTASVTFSTTLVDPTGRYTFRFDAGPTSVTAAIQVTP